MGSITIDSHEIIDSSDSDSEVPILVAVQQDSTAGSGIAYHPTTACPVTILSGFLGSGKTTLVQYILNNTEHGKRIAVIENEFGGDDDNRPLQVESLIARDGVTSNTNGESNNLTDLLELPNGCVCCTVKDSLVATLESLLQKRHDLDYILIECSGMANPGPIASLFWLDEGLSRLRLDGIVTLVDAVNIHRQLDTTVECSQQIAYADRVLVNKIDLLQENDDQVEEQAPRLEIIQTLVRKLNPTAQLRSASYAAVPDLDWLLNANCFDSNRIEDIDRALMEMNNIESQTSCAPHCGGGHHHHHHHDHGDNDQHVQECQECNTAFVPQRHPQHHHTREVSTVSIVLESTSMDLRKMNKWLATILWPHQDEKDRVLTKILHDTGSSSQSNGGVHQSLTLTDSMDLFRIKGVISGGYANLESADMDDALVNKSNCIEKRAHKDRHFYLDRRRFIVQGVHDLWEIHASSNEDLLWQSDEQRTCKMVFIGRNLDKVALREGVASCKLVE